MGEGAIIEDRNHMKQRKRRSLKEITEKDCSEAALAQDFLQAQPINVAETAGLAPGREGDSSRTGHV